MKFILVSVFVLSIIVQGRAKPPKEKENMIECLAENDIKEEEFDKLTENNDPKLHCIVACILEKDGVLKNGDIDKDALKKDILNDLPFISDNKVTEVVDSCMEFADAVTDICDKTNRIGYCLKDALDKLNIKMHH